MFERRRETGVTMLGMPQRSTAATVPAPTTAPAARRLTDDCAMAHGVYTSKRSVMAKLFHRFGITCERP